MRTNVYNVLSGYSRQVLTMDFIEGFPLLRLGEVMKERGINPDGAIGRIAQRLISKTYKAFIYLFLIYRRIECLGCPMLDILQLFLAQIIKNKRTKFCNRIPKQSKIFSA